MRGRLLFDFVAGGRCKEAWFWKIFTFRLFQISQDVSIANDIIVLLRCPHLMQFSIKDLTMALNDHSSSFVFAAPTIEKHLSKHLWFSDIWKGDVPQILELDGIRGKYHNLAYCVSQAGLTGLSCKSYCGEQAKRKFSFGWHLNLPNCEHLGGRCLTSYLRFVSRGCRVWTANCEFPTTGVWRTQSLGFLE
jgi:hypothetical protein